MSDDEIDYEEISQIIGLTQKVLDILLEEKNPTIPIRALTSSVTFLICNGLDSRQEAEKAVEFFQRALTEAINKAEELGVASWCQRTRH